MDSKPLNAVVGSRRQGREAALQILYLVDNCRQEAVELPEAAWSADTLAPKTRAFAFELVDGVREHQEAIDEIIRKYTQNWDMARMAVIDRCILRLASFELLHETQTPVNVIINEAVEIAKKFSTAESSKFVNGILDKVKLERKP